MAQIRPIETKLTYEQFRSAVGVHDMELVGSKARSPETRNASNTKATLQKVILPAWCEARCGSRCTALFTGLIGQSNCQVFILLAMICNVNQALADGRLLEANQEPANRNIARKPRIIYFQKP